MPKTTTGGGSSPRDGAYTQAYTDSYKAPATGSWYGLADTLRLQAAEAEAERSRDPVACPNDGEPLKEGPGGVLFCPFDGWRPGR